MPQTTVKLIWSMSACNFCPRSDVRTCQIKPGKLLSKLSSALDLEESILDSSEGICTCCLADVDMIIRSVAIRGAMKDYYVDMIQNLPRSYDNNYINANYQGKAILTSPDERRVDNTISYNNSMESQQKVELSPAPLLPPLFARPPFSKADDVLPAPNDSTELHVKSATIPPPPPPPPVSTTKKPKDRMTRYQCMLCDKIAGSKSHCMEHLICHSPVRPFTCSQCMKTYKSRKACREHLIVMHGVEKVEENLQRLVLVDHDDLQQLDNVCTQYRKICNTSAILPTKRAAESQNSSFMLPQFKEEPPEVKIVADMNMGSSAWLYKPIGEEPSRLPPPLLQCLPSSSPFSANQSPAVNETVPPPSKRNRKGTPHKLIHESLPEEIVPEKLQLEPAEDSNDEECSLIESNKLQNVVPILDDEVFFSPSQERHYSTNVNQPFFPSFQTYKTEPSLPPSSNGYSPTGVSRKNLPPCQICGRCFPTKEKMADHMRSHSEVKQFSCLVCNRFFKYRRGVTNHLKEVHHMTNRNEISGKVASHEVGCIVPPKSKARDRKRKKAGRMVDNYHSDVASTDISQKVIEDTLSSLADIQHATGTTLMTSQVTSDEESDGEHDDSMSPAQSHTLHYEATDAMDESLISVDDGNGTISSSDENPMLSKGLDCESVSVGASTQIEDLSSPTGATFTKDTVLSHGAVNC